MPLRSTVPGAPRRLNSRGPPAARPAIMGTRGVPVSPRGGGAPARRRAGAHGDRPARPHSLSDLPGDRRARSSASCPASRPWRLDPEIVFLIFLPPILWAAAYFTSLRDFQANLRPITLLAVGLVLATTAGVAAVAHAIVPGLGWPAAFVLGAIVSPPDAVAATAIARRLRIPHRVVTILEGESLVNDAAALVLYRAGVIAAVTGAFVREGDALAVRPGGRGRRGHRPGGRLRDAGGPPSLRGQPGGDGDHAPGALRGLDPGRARSHASAVLACVVGGIYVRAGLQRGRAAHDADPGAGGLGPPRSSS